MGRIPGRMVRKIDEIEGIHAAMAVLSGQTRVYLREQLTGIGEHQVANAQFFEKCGIASFFISQRAFQHFQEALYDDTPRTQRTQARREYGDFQTPAVLAEAVCAYLRDQGRQPELLVEPTCGAGAFVLAALRHFPSLQMVYGVDIHAPYCWETKGRILEWALTRTSYPEVSKSFPRIILTCGNVFTHDFQMLAEQFTGREVLVLGNPPWVTNAELSRLHSQNLPQKRNVKALRGLDALTGSSNFDISETVVRLMLNTFARQRGSLAMLVKQAVVKHVLHDLPALPYALQDIRTSRIDARKFFKASVEAALFETTFQAPVPARTCRVSGFDSPQTGSSVFGWTGKHFVADIEVYQKVAVFDGISPFEWRQGLKHDCAKVMELERHNGGWENKLGEHVYIEPEIVYGLLKSSDLKIPVVTAPRKYVPVTQRMLGEDTASLATSFPRAFAYLSRHRNRFERRKSILYKGKPPFSIFGIGKYAFAPYKVAISGLYKQPNFALVLPDQEGRPQMLDDTCYFVGFTALHEAIYVWALLHSDTTRLLLQAIVFHEDKRPYNKQRLMRIGLDRLARTLSYNEILGIIQGLDTHIATQVSQATWDIFMKQFSES